MSSVRMQTAYLLNDELLLCKYSLANTTHLPALHHTHIAMITELEGGREGGRGEERERRGRGEERERRGGEEEAL